MLMRGSLWEGIEGAESAGERSLLTFLWRPRANIFIFSGVMYSFTMESLVGLRSHAEGTMFLPGLSESLSCFISLTPFLSEFPLLPPHATQATLPMGPCVPVRGSVWIMCRSGLMFHISSPPWGWVGPIHCPTWCLAL